MFKSLISFLKPQSSNNDLFVGFLLRVSEDVVLRQLVEGAAESRVGYGRVEDVLTVHFSSSPKAGFYHVCAGRIHLK